MIVCHCRALTDRDVRSAVQCGAVTRASVARACGAGADCGGCRPVVDEIVGQELARNAQCRRPHAGVREQTAIAAG
jgi:bacterioferritin-associated ferredoxin